MLKDDIGLGEHEVIFQDVSNFVKINLVELMVLKWRLEPAETFEDLQDLLCRISDRDLGMRHTILKSTRLRSQWSELGSVAGLGSLESDVKRRFLSLLLVLEVENSRLY